MLNMKSPSKNVCSQSILGWKAVVSSFLSIQPTAVTPTNVAREVRVKAVSQGSTHAVSLIVCFPFSSKLSATKLLVEGDKFCLEMRTMGSEM